MYRSHVLVCGGTGCTSSNSNAVQNAFAENIEKYGLSEEVKLVQTGCFGVQGDNVLDGGQKFL